MSRSLRASASENPGGFNFHWAHSGGGLEADVANGVAVGRYGQVYVAGAVQGSSASFDTLKLSPKGSSDAFLATYDHGGGLIWARSAGGPNQDAGLAVAVDSQGNSILAGYYQAGALFGDLAVTNAGVSDAFIAKYDSAGSILWVRTVGGTGEETANSVAVDADDNCYLTGYFQKAASFGSTSLTNRGGVDLFLAKYDPNGTLLWARSAGGPGEDIAFAVATDPQGGVVVAGYFNGQAQFESVQLVAAGKKDLFVAKYDSSGALQWANSAGGLLDDIARSLAVDTEGGVVVAGTLEPGDVQFGATTLTGTVKRTFVARYDGTGLLQWVRVAGGSESRGVAVRGSDIFAMGYFSGTARVDTYQLTSAGGIDIFLSRYRRDGGLEWARSVGGTNADNGYALAVDDQEGCLIAGQFNGGTQFDGFNLRSAGVGDAFVARLSPEPLISAALPTSQTLPPESDGQFRVSVEGADPIRIQWVYNGTQSLENQTNGLLTLTNMDRSFQGLYQAIASNIYGAATSAPAFLNIAGIPLPQVWANGVRGLSFDFTNTTEVEVSLRIGVPGVALYYTTNESAPTLASIPYIRPFTLSGSRTVRAIAYDSQLVSSQTPSVPITFYLGAPLITVDGQTGTNFSFSNQSLVNVAIASGLPAAEVRYSVDGSALSTHSPLYTSPLVVTQSLTVRAYSSLSGMISATSAPVAIHLFSFYPLTVASITDGSIEVRPPTGPYRADSVVQLSAQPAPGWVFLSWTDDVAGSNAQQSVVMDGPKQVGALFGAALTIASAGAGEGTVVVDPVLPAYPRGTAIRMWAIPSVRSFFALWGGAGSPAGSNNPSSFVIQNSAPTLSAIFSPLATNTFSVTAIPSLEGTLVMQPLLPYYAKGAVVSLTAIPNPNRRLGRWEIATLASPEKPASISHDNPLRLIVTNSFILNAYFESGPIFLTPELSGKTNLVVRISGDPGVLLAFQVATNLFDWSTFMTRTNVTGIDRFTISETNLTARFTNQAVKFFRILVE